MGTTSVWGKDNESKDLEAETKEEQGPTSKSAPWAISSSESNPNDMPQISASETTKTSQNLQNKASPSLKGKNWADISDDDDDDGDENGGGDARDLVQQQIYKQQTQPQMKFQLEATNEVMPAIIIVTTISTPREEARLTLAAVNTT